MIKLPLKHPIKLDKTEISELSFRDYTTAGDYLAFDKRGGVAQTLALIASMSGTDETLIIRLRGPDYRAAQRIVDKLIAEDEASATEVADPEKKSQES